jgi:hypothetical protein
MVNLMICRISVRGERGVGNVVNVDKCEERECGEYMELM